MICPVPIRLAPSFGSGTVRTGEREHLIDVGQQRSPKVVRRKAQFGFGLSFRLSPLKLTALVPMQSAQCSEAEMMSVTEPEIREEICLERSITSKLWNLL